MCPFICRAQGLEVLAVPEQLLREQQAIDAIDFIGLSQYAHQSLSLRLYGACSAGNKCHTDIVTLLKELEKEEDQI